MNDKPQANWLTRLTKMTGLQLASGWDGMCRVWHNIIGFPKLFEALLVFVGLLQGYVLWRTDEALHLAAKAQQAAAGTADKMRLIIDAMERPWVSAAKISVGDVSWKDGEAKFTVLVNLKNTGHSPALSVEVTPVAYPSIDFNVLLAKQREISETSRHHPATMGTVVFPGDAVSAGANIPLTRADIEAFQKFVQGGKNTPPVPFVPAVIIVVIDYIGAGESDHHQTGYMLSLYYHDPARPTVPSLSLPIGVDIPAANLKLEYQILGQYAY